MEALGLCLGASTLSLVHLRKENGKTEIIECDTITHEGNPRKVLLETLEKMPVARENTCRSDRTEILQFRKTLYRF